MKLFEEEYMTVTTDDEDEMALIKEAITHLSPVQRKIFLTYVESGTYTETARLFKVSTPTVKKYIQEIKNKIINYVARCLI